MSRPPVVRPLVLAAAVVMTASAPALADDDAPRTTSSRAAGNARASASRVARKYGAERSPPSSSTGADTADSSA